MDLSHGTPYVSPVEVAAGSFEDIAGSDIIVITAGKRQLPGQTRMDLAKANVDVYRQMIPLIVKNAPDAILLVVTNPVDVMAYAAYRLSGKPATSVISSGTVLDSARLRHLLARHCGIDPHNVHAYVLGEHGDSEFPVWSRAMLGGIDLTNYCPVCQQRCSGNRDRELDALFLEVRDSAYKIIEKKGETSYGIGLSLGRITRAILHDENSILPVSTLLKDYLGVSDVYLSVPVVLNRAGVRQQLPIELNELELSQFRKSAEAVRKAILEVGL
jgi:L-lactate dehydrogenase